MNLKGFLKCTQILIIITFIKIMFKIAFAAVLGYTVNSLKLNKGYDASDPLGRNEAKT